jgi:oxygen-independent coproporphyrinogen-3 oxidase
MDLSPGPSADRWIKPQAAYLHVPFCRHRCGYCNFSVVSGRDELIERFLDAIDRELTWISRPSVRTVFLGGGTPTHLDPRQLERLLRMVRERFEFDDDVEWSIEANPEDVTREKLALLVDHGVNRISLGVQSFNREKLGVLQRGHDRAAAIKAVELAASRIANISIDLIFAAPDETLDIWRQDVETAFQLPIRHLSTYSLTFEKGTSFWSQRHRGLLQPVGEDDEVEMYQFVRRCADSVRMEQYEISNFAQPGFRCAHNVAYWQGEGWFAAGPGAARFVGGVREVNHRSTSTYLRRIESGRDPTAEREAMTLTQYARERFAFGIRMLDGIDTRALSESVGLNVLELCREAVETSIAEGLLEQQAQNLKLSERGILFADTVASRLLG